MLFLIFYRLAERSSLCCNWDKSLVMCLAKLRHAQGYRFINFVSEGCCVACMLCCTYSCFVYVCVSIV